MRKMSMLAMQYERTIAEMLQQQQVSSVVLNFVTVSHFALFCQVMMDEAQLTEQEALRQQLQQEQDLLQQFQEKQEAKLLNQHDREKRLMDEQVENSRRDLEKQVSRCTCLSVQTVTHSLYSLQSKQVCHWEGETSFSVQM